MDDVQNAWNNAPACVLATVWVGHGVESQTWPFRSAPCLSIRQVRHCAIVRAARLPSRNCVRDARKPVDMWTTPARCPQTHRIKNNKSKLNLIALEAQKSDPD